MPFLNAVPLALMDIVDKSQQIPFFAKQVGVALKECPHPFF